MLARLFSAARFGRLLARLIVVALLLAEAGLVHALVLPALAAAADDACDDCCPREDEGVPCEPAGPECRCRALPVQDLPALAPLAPPGAPAQPLVLRSAPQVPDRTPDRVFRPPRA